MDRNEGRDSGAVPCDDGCCACDVVPGKAVPCDDEAGCASDAKSWDDACCASGGSAFSGRVGFAPKSAREPDGTCADLGPGMFLTVLSDSAPACVAAAE